MVLIPFPVEVSMNVFVSSSVLIQLRPLSSGNMFKKLYKLDNLSSTVENADCACNPTSRTGENQGSTLPAAIFTHPVMSFSSVSEVDSTTREKGKVRRNCQKKKKDRRRRMKIGYKSNKGRHFLQSSSFSDVIVIEQSLWNDVSKVLRLDVA